LELALQSDKQGSLLEAFAEAALDAVGSHVAIIDMSGRIAAVNRAWEEFARRNHGNPSLVSGGANYIHVCERSLAAGDADAKQVLRLIRLVAMGKSSGEIYEYPCHSPDQNRWFSVGIRPFDHHGERYLVVWHDDITERRENEERALYLATHDPVTGLANRTLYQIHANQALSTDNETPVSLVFVDLDGFKQVNDTFGHDRGDEVLRESGQILSGLIGPSDTVARLGGDEFAILLVGDNGARQPAEEMRSKVKAALTRIVSVNGANVKVGASAGLAYHPDDGTSLDALESHADRAMYLDKAGTHGVRGDGSERDSRYLRLFNSTDVYIWDEDWTVVARELERLRSDGVRSLRRYLALNPKTAQRLASMVSVNDVNESSASIFGFASRDELVAQASELLAPEPIETFIDQACALWEGRTLFRGDTVLIDPSGATRECILSMPLADREDALAHVPVSVVDVTERRLHERKVERLAFHDALTDLPNRALLKDRIEQAAARLERTGERFALHLMDLDGFKDVNDTLGHEAGDDLLVSVAERLKECARATDTVSRLGGDEFAVLQTNIGDAASAGLFAGRLLASMEREFDLRATKFRLGASIGIVLGEVGKEPGEYLSHADLALYEAKDQGGRRYCLHTPALVSRMSRDIGILQEFQTALSRRDLTLYFQPQYNIGSGGLVGFEALVRWPQPDGSLVPPSAFVPLAERAGLYRELGDFVIAEAAQHLADWFAAGIRPPRIAINISAPHARDGGFAEDVINELKARGLPGSALEVEITESALMRQTEPTLAAFSALREFGVSIAIDDFGTGYSSLEYLQVFPVDRLKIAMPFVRNVYENSRNAAIVRAVVALGHEFNLRLVAEGVETDEELEFLRAVGCDELQGFLASAPVPASRVPWLIAKGTANQQTADRTTEDHVGAAQ